MAYNSVSPSNFQLIRPFNSENALLRSVALQRLELNAIRLTHTLYRLRSIIAAPNNVSITVKYRNFTFVNTTTTTNTKVEFSTCNISTLIFGYVFISRK